MNAHTRDRSVASTRLLVSSSAKSPTGAAVHKSRRYLRIQVCLGGFPIEVRGRRAGRGRRWFGRGGGWREWGGGLGGVRIGGGDARGDGIRQQLAGGGVLWIQFQGLCQG